MFDKPEKSSDGALGETFRLMDQFTDLMQTRIRAGKDNNHMLRKYEIWTLGLRASLDELEQSRYAAIRFQERIKAVSVQQMSEEELLNYNRYVYFDKNGFIRAFALLDKLGTFLNELLGVRTELVKSHYSYFTVLRNMREKNAHPDLIWKLNVVKEQYKEPMKRLRSRRNTEIHYMNSEMTDDLIQSNRMYGEETKLENIALQMNDLTDSLHMANESLRLTFQYACKIMRSR